MSMLPFKRITSYENGYDPNAVPPSYLQLERSAMPGRPSFREDCDRLGKMIMEPNLSFGVLRSIPGWFMEIRQGS